MPLAIGILLPLLKQSHQNDLKSLYHNVHEMQNIAKKSVSIISEHLKGVVTKNFSWAFPVLRTPLILPNFEGTILSHEIVLLES